MTSKEIALSASHAAWLGALASACASAIALGIAIYGARGEESRRRRLAKATQSHPDPQQAS